MLTVGTKAPNFTLSDKDGNMVSLSDFTGKKVVLYFYPKDNTPGVPNKPVAIEMNIANLKNRMQLLLVLAKTA